MSNFIVSMTIKEHRGDFTPKIDKFVGTPEKARDLLHLKYCCKKSFYSAVEKAFSMAGQHFDDMVKKKDKVVEFEEVLDETSNKLL